MVMLLMPERLAQIHQEMLKVLKSVKCRNLKYSDQVSLRRELHPSRDVV